MSRKKIILYNPKSVFFDMPLALLALASSLDRSKFEPVIIDGRLNGSSAVHELAREALCLGVTVLTGSPIRDALATSRAVRASNPRLPVVWGGWHPSLFSEDILREESSVDFTVRGQGETVFRELVGCLSKGEIPEHISGLALRRGSKTVSTPDRPLEDMNRLPTVDYGLIDSAAYFERKGKRQLDYITSIGCFFRCAFCADPFVFKRKWTGLEPGRIADELGFWKRRLNFTDVNFQDETFFTYRRRVVDIANAFLEQGLGISWAATMRADQGCRLREEDFGLLARSGLRRVLIGVESGSQEMLDHIKKDIRIEQVTECADRCRREKIGAIFPFIVGFPDETEEQLFATLDLALALRKMSPDFTTPIFYFHPFPGSQITMGLGGGGLQRPTTLEEWGHFDYVGKPGPWVSEHKYRLTERFKFYSGLAYNARRAWFAKPLKWLARWRCERRFFDLTFEKSAIEAIRPPHPLS